MRVYLNSVYRFKEYKNALSYAEKNISIKGMQDLVERLNMEKANYCTSMQELVEPEKEIENHKYEVYHKWYLVKTITKWIEIVALVIWVISYVLTYIFQNSVFGYLSFLIVLFILGLPILLVAKIGESICAILYRNYTANLLEKINGLNADFADTADRYYKAMDNLYLASLDPTHREVVLMRREQAEHNAIMRKKQEAHNRKMAQYEEDRQKIENDRMKELRKTRKAQERLLEIEEEREREKKYKGWY